MADGVVFLPSFHEAIKDLPDQERLGAYDAVIRFGLYGEITEMSPTVKSLFALMRPVIEASQRRYQTAKVNGSKGGRPRKNQTGNQRKNQTGNQNRNQDIDIDKDSDLDIDLDNDSSPSDLPQPYHPLGEAEFEELRRQAMDKFNRATR